LFVGSLNHFCADVWSNAFRHTNTHDWPGSKCFDHDSRSCATGGGVNFHPASEASIAVWLLTGCDSEGARVRGAPILAVLALVSLARACWVHGRFLFVTCCCNFRFWRDSPTTAQNTRPHASQVQPDSSFHVPVASSHLTLVFGTEPLARKALIRNEYIFHCGLDHPGS
jgi:hypothetical protein